jgi:hypothetical protein
MACQDINAKPPEATCALLARKASMPEGAFYMAKISNVG